MMDAARVTAWVEAFPLWERAVAFLSIAFPRSYLVGGSVRDALLERPSDDLDVAVEGEVYPLARALANHLGGAFVGLDDERQVARVVVRHDRVPYHVDLARLRADDIAGDLRARDYTINAMAVPLPLTSLALLDPCGGRTDLAGRVLRAVYDGAMRDDPLRVLRGVRLAGALGLVWNAETRALARAAVPALSAVSGERLRDELFNILALPQASAALRCAADLGALAAMGLAWSSSTEEAPMASVVRVEQAWQVPTGGALSALLQAYRQEIAAYWATSLSEGRRRRELFTLALLLRTRSDTDGIRLAERLKLSRREATHLSALQRAIERLRVPRSVLTRLDIYRYYRASGEAGVNAALAAAACHPTAESLSMASDLLDAWFHQRASIVDPSPLLSGADVMGLLRLPEGRLVGELLEALREAQVSGDVRDHEQARAFVISRTTVD